MKQRFITLILKIIKRVLQVLQNTLFKFRRRSEELENAELVKQAESFKAFMACPEYKELIAKLDEIARKSGLGAKDPDSLLISTGERELANKLLENYRKLEELVRDLLN